MVLPEIYRRFGSYLLLMAYMAGVHWRSDTTASIRFGESIALVFLDDMRDCYHENFDGFALTTFAGEKIRIGEVAPSRQRERTRRHKDTKMRD